MAIQRRNMSPIIGYLDGADIGVIVAYFVAVFAVGIWSSFRNRGSVGGYFLAGRSMSWIPVGASLFASNIGSGHFIGLAGSGASSGVAIAVFEYNAAFTLGFLGWLFLPVYVVSGILTMPEYLRHRFGGQRIRVYLAVIALLLYIFTKISADLYAGAVFIQQATEISIYPAAIILLVVAALFTIMGGLTAVIWTDFAQVLIMIAGALYLSIRSFQVTGGFDNLVVNYFNAIPNTTRAYRSTTFSAANSAQGYSPDLYGTESDRNIILLAANPPDQSRGVFAECSIPPSDALQFFKSINSTDLPWVGVVFGLTINATWYWCTDQVIVQRCLAAKNMIHAKAGIVLAMFIKMLPLWLMVIPGMAARILFADTVACGDANLCQKICSKVAGCTDIAYPSLVLNLLPSGARGLMLSVMMASLVSSLTSIFNSTSTIFTVDIWRLIRPHCKDAELMIVGRAVVLILVGISLAWIPIVQLSGELFSYIQSVTGYLAPPICATYVFAIFWHRTNEIGVFCALIVGLIIGATRFAWEIAYGATPCGEVITNPPHFLVTMHYLHFSILLFFISSVVIVVATLVTPPLPPRFTRRLIFADRHAPFDPDLDAPKVTIVSEEEKAEWLAEGEELQPYLHWYRKAINWMCGVESMQDQREPVFTEEEAEELIEMKKSEMSIEEDPKQRLIVNTAVCTAIVVTIFIWAFFA
ncbi:Sodium/glucose cotransporter 1 [Echinococcus granulosus]|nr:Sodium/glucose cotransporter 1 [Echinococcus granulosus]